MKHLRKRLIEHTDRLTWLDRIALRRLLRRGVLVSQDRYLTHYDYYTNQLKRPYCIYLTEAEREKYRG